MKKIRLLLSRLLDFKNSLNNIRSNHFVDQFDKQDVFTFYIIYKPTQMVIYHCSTLYPTREIAQWSAVNYFNWFLHDYKQDDIIIGISTGIPEIIDTDNVRQPL